MDRSIVEAVRDFLMDLYVKFQDRKDDSGEIPDWVFPSDEEVQEALAAAGWQEQGTGSTRLAHPATSAGSSVAGLADTLIARCCPTPELRARVRQAAADYEQLRSGPTRKQ